MDLNIEDRLMLEKMFIQSRNLNKTIVHKDNCVKIEDKVLKFLLTDSSTHKTLFYDDVIVEFDLKGRHLGIFFICPNKEFFIYNNKFYFSRPISNFIPLDNDLHVTYDDLPNNIYEWSEEDIFYYKLKYQ